jgi:hypothetical protein
MRVLGAIALLVALVSSPAAAGSEEGDGSLTAIACGRLEAPYRFEVALDDDGPAFERLDGAMRSALAARRVEVVADAPLRLSLHVDTVRSVPRIRRPDMGRFRQHADRGTEIEINLWSNQHDSLLGGRRENALRAAIDELRVEIAISDKSNGRCIWHGEAVVDLDGRDPDRSAAAVIPLLVARLGETVRAEPISLD